MKRGIWLTYDLGVKGDYNNLYAWLDDHGAIECGNNLAFLYYEAITAHKDEEFINCIRAELKERIKLEPGNRIYIIRAAQDDGKKTIKGTFLIGKRKASPWEGYGEKSNETNEEV